MNQKYSLYIIAILSVLVSPMAVAESEFTLTINRNMTCNDQSTIGMLAIDGKEIGRTLELPWKNNEKNISRIPEGNYPAIIRSDGSRGWRIQLTGVENRDNIQIHIGNYAREIEGCILVGDDVTNNGGECLVTKSEGAILKIADEMSKFSADLGGDKSVPINIIVVVN